METRSDKRTGQHWEDTGWGQTDCKEQRRKWKWIGHALKKGRHNITGMAMRWNPQEKRKTRRPKLSWRHTVTKELDNIGKTLGDGNWLQRTESSRGLKWRPNFWGGAKRIKSSNNYTVLHPKTWFKTLTSKKLQFVIATDSTPATLISFCITLSLLWSGSNANIFLQKKKIPQYY